MPDKMRLQLILDALDNTKGGISSAKRGVSGLTTSVALLAGKFAVVDYAVRRTFDMIASAVKPAYMAVEEFQQSVVRSAAMIASFQQTGDLSENYRKARDYAEGLVYQLEEIDAKTAASARDLAQMTEEMVKQRVVLDTNNAAAVEGFRNIANAVAVIAGGYQNKEIQIRQEMRALLQGEVNMYSQLAQQVNAMVGGGLKEKVELWKEEGTIIENIGGLLRGYAAASDDIQGTWSAIGSTMETVQKRILREGFNAAYADINAALIRINNYLKAHSDEVSGPLQRGYLAVKGVMEAIGDAAGVIWTVIEPPARLLWETTKMVLDGWGMLAYTVLPVFTQWLADGVNMLADMVEAATRLGRLLLAALSFDREGMKREGEAVKAWMTRLGEDAGKVFAPGFWEQVGSRAEEYLRAGSKRPNVEAPDLGKGKAPQGDDGVYDGAGNVMDKAAQEAFEARVKYYNDIARMQAEEAARIEQDAMTRLGGEAKRRAADEEYRKQLAERLQTLREALYSEEETIEASYAARIALVQEAFEAGELPNAEARDAMIVKAAQDRENRLTEIKKRGTESRKALMSAETQSAVGMLGQMFGLLASTQDQGNKKQFERYKLFAKAQAAVSTGLAVVNALATTPFVPVGLAMSIMAGAMGGAQIAQIENQNYRGGRAAGGLVMPGETVIVGEEGPEGLTLGGRKPAYVTPNHKLRGGASGGPTYNITNVNQISPGLPGAVRAEIARALPSLTQGVLAAVKQALVGDYDMARAAGRTA